jgi:hypothetical protein
MDHGAIALRFTPKFFAILFGRIDRAEKHAF